jgi:hypothetical protein
VRAALRKLDPHEKRIALPRLSKEEEELSKLSIEQLRKWALERLGRYVDRGDRHGPVTSQPAPTLMSLRDRRLAQAASIKCGLPDGRDLGAVKQWDEVGSHETESI